MSKAFKVVINEFVYGGHLLSLGAASIVWTILIWIDKSNGLEIIILAYFISQIVYSYDHLSDLKKADKNSNKERTDHIFITKNYQILSFGVNVILFLALLFYVRTNASLLALIIVIAGILYSYKTKQLTRNILGFKNIYVALFWGVLTYLVVLFYSIPLTNIFMFSIFTFIFLRWIINTTYFDIKDVEKDREERLKTIPAVFGIRSTIFYLQLVNLMSALLLILMVYLGVFPVFSLIMLLFSFYSVYYLIMASRVTKKRLRIISYIVVDGEYIFWPIALLMGKIIFR